MRFLLFLFLFLLQPSIPPSLLDPLLLPGVGLGYEEEKNICLVDLLDPEMPHLYKL